MKQKIFVTVRRADHSFQNSDIGMVFMQPNCKQNFDKQRRANNRESKKETQNRGRRTNRDMVM